MNFRSVLMASAVRGCGGAPTTPAVVAIHYDATSPSNYTTGTGGVSTLNDLSGNSRNGTQATTGARPDISAAAVNGKDVLAFTGANNDALSIGSALSFSNNVSCVWVLGMIKYAALPVSANDLLWTIPASVSGNRFALTITPAGKLRLGAKRVQADSTLTVVGSATSLSAGEQQFFYAAANYRTGFATFRTDDTSESIAFGTGAGWATSPGVGSTENVNSASAPTFGRVGSSVFGGQIGIIVCGTGELTPAELQAWHDTIRSTFATPQITVAIDEPSASLNRLYQQSGGSRTLSVTVNVEVGADADIEARLIDATTLAEEVAWATKGTSSGGVLEFDWSIPAGGYFMEARKVGESTLSAYRTVGRVLVGDNTAESGQSNGQFMFSNERRFAPYAPLIAGGAATTLPGTGETLKLRRDSGYGSFEPSATSAGSSQANATGEPTGTGGPTNLNVGGNGETLKGLLMQAAQGYPQGSHAYNIGGSASSTWLPGGSSWVIMEAGLERAGGPGWTEFQAIEITNGEADANAATDGATYKSNVLATVAEIRTRASNATMPVFLGLLGGLGTSTTDAAVDAIRQAQLELIDSEPNFYLATSILDQTMQDTQHYVGIAYEYSARRRAQNMLKWKGVTATGAAGPKITSGVAATGSNIVTLTPTLDGGTTLVDASGNASSTTLSNWEVQVDGAARTVTQAALSSGTVVLTFDGSTLTGGQVVGVRYLYGKLATITNIVRDDTTVQGSDIGVPMQPTRGWFEVTAA